MSWSHAGPPEELLPDGQQRLLGLLRVQHFDVPCTADPASAFDKSLRKQLLMPA